MFYFREQGQPAPPLFSFLYYPPEGQLIFLIRVIKQRNADNYAKNFTPTSVATALAASRPCFSFATVPIYKRIYS